MTSMLRYVRCLQKLNRAGWKVTHNQQTLITGGKFILQQNNYNLIKSYATATATVSKITIFGNNMKFQNFEDQMKRTGKVNKSDINILIDEIQQLETVSTLDALLLIRSCGKTLIESNSKESIQLVQEIWSTLEALDTPLDVSHYNTLLNVYIEKDHDFSPTEFLKMMKDKSVEPNRVTYQKLIRAHCNKGDIAGATKVLGTMKDEGMQLSEDVFNSLILGHSQANDLESAKKTLDVMKTAGLPPSADTYTELMCAYAKYGDLDLILKTLKSLQQEEIVLLNSHYLEILYSLAVNGHEDKAYEFLKELPTDMLSDVEVSKYLFKLIFAHHVDLALKLLLTTTTDLTRRKIRTKSFVRAMIKGNVPIEKVVEICRYFEQELQLNQAFYTALDALFNFNPKYEKALTLLKNWAELGSDIRDHYFWPLLVHEAKTGNMEGVRHILSSMVNDFKITPSIETLKNYVIPYMYGTWENVMEFLKPLNIPYEIICNAIADRLLVERKIKNCATFMTIYPSVYSKDVLLNHAVETLNARDDFRSFVIILRNISENADPADVDNTPISLVDAALKSVISIIPEYKSKIIIKLLNELVNSGLSISPEMALEVESYLSNVLSTDVEKSIKKLSSGTLTIVPMCDYNMTDTQDIKSVVNGKRIVELRRSFATYLDQSDVERVWDVIQALKAVEYLSVPVYAQAISLFSEKENLKAAESCINYLKEKIPDAKLDFKKIIKYAELLIKKDRFNDAITFIAEQRDGEASEKLSRSLMNNVRCLLETTANTKNVEYLNQLFNLLNSKNYITIDNFTLGPFIKIHILRNDLEEALVAFEKACKDYRCTPYKNLLAKAFIETEDANCLQRMTDLCTEIHGESNALVDLALSFLEHGHLKQAQKIFKTPGLQIFNEKITAAIEHFTKFNKLEALNKMVKITKSAARMDRAFMYDNLLDCHYQNNNWRAGLALWTDMQEDDVQPTSHFLHVLNILLEKNNQPVPFSYNKTNSEPKTIMVQNHQDDEFNQSLQQKNYAHANTLLDSENWTRKKFIDKYNIYVNKLLEHGELDRALAVATTLINKYGTIGKRAFSELAHQLIKAKRFTEAKELGTLLDQDTKDKVSYWKLLSNIEIHEKGLKHFIDNLEIKIANSQSAKLLEKSIHFGSVVHALLADPSYVNEFEKWALKLWNSDVTRGIQALWNFYFIGDHAKEAQLYEKYVRSHSSPLIRPIIEVAKERKDPVLLKKLLERLDMHPQLSINIKARTYTGLIEIYLALNQTKQALETLHEVTKHFRMEVIPMKVLLNLKDQCEKIKLPFPYIFTTQRRKQGSEENNEQQNDDTHAEKARM